MLGAWWITTALGALWMEAVEPAPGVWVAHVGGPALHLVPRCVQVFPVDGPHREAALYLARLVTLGVAPVLDVEAPVRAMGGVL